MTKSLESSRPILNISRNRSSTYSAATSSVASNAEDLRFADIESGLKRLEDRRMQNQRFVPSDKKFETISKLALGAKLDRALRRRMTGQDALPVRRATVKTPQKAQ